MITEDYVSFKTAKLLKEKGFHEECKCQYGRHGSISWTSCNNGSVITFARPTIQMAMKWLREVHKIYIDIASTHSDDGFIHFIWQTYNSDYLVTGDCDIFYPAYEQACEAAIKYCLENLI